MHKKAVVHIHNGMGREEGSGWGTRVYLSWIHFDIWQNQYNIVKFKNKIKFKKVIKKKKNKNSDFLLAVLGLHWCTRAFSRGSKLELDSSCAAQASCRGGFSRCREGLEARGLR